VNEYRGDSGAIARIFPQPVGSKLVYEGDNKAVYMFNPVNDICLPLPQYSGSLENVLWDLADANLFAVLDGMQCHTFLYHPLSITGPTIKFLGECADASKACCNTLGCWSGSSCNGHRCHKLCDHCNQIWAAARS
jgi:WD repeat-containing protein 19